MNILNWIRRYAVCFLGLLIISFGVVFITKSEMGVSPISSIPYSMSLIVPQLTFGNWVIIFNGLLILIQIAILRKDSNIPDMIMQLIISVLFGYFTDFAVFVMGDFAVSGYLARVASLLVGCVIVALGAYVEVNAKASMVPGDAFIHTLSKVTKVEFGKVRVVSDMSMGIIAGILCLVFLGKLSGVREGTVISALIVGNMVRIFSRKLKPMMDFLVPLTEEEKAAIATANEELEIVHSNKVITITREYGSCGHEIGQKLAEKLGIAFYDREIIGLVAREGGYTERFVEEHEQKLENYLLHDFYTWYSAAAFAEDMPMADQLFKIEERVIRKLVENESCVIVGRLADYILRDYQHATKVLINADRDDRVRKVSEREKLSLMEASKKVSKIDKQRENHRHYFTHKKWNNSGEYDIVLKSNKYGVDKCVEIITSAVNN